MIINPSPLKEGTSTHSQEVSAERRLRTSKLKSLQNQLEILIQKKIRIDLEIKRTKKKLSKIKESSKTEVKTRLSLEGFDYDSLTLDQSRLFQEKFPDEFKDLLALDEQIVHSEELLQESEELPLFEVLD